MNSSFLENYRAKHQHPLNHLTHAIGIPLIIISLPLLPFNWHWALGLFIIGWLFQFLGHFIEGNKPAFYGNPIYLLVGPIWLLKKTGAVFGLATERETSRRR